MLPAPRERAADARPARFAGFGTGGLTGTGLTSGTAGFTSTISTPSSLSPFGAVPTPLSSGAGAGSGTCEASICGQCLVPPGAPSGAYVCCCDRACKTNNAATDPKGNCCAGFATVCPGQQ